MTLKQMTVLQNCRAKCCYSIKSVAIQVTKIEFEKKRTAKNAGALVMVCHGFYEIGKVVGRDTLTHSQKHFSFLLKHSLQCSVAHREEAFIHNI